MDRTCGKLRRAIVCLLLLLVGDVTSVRNLKITVPERVRYGDSALLTCSYGLDAALYTIKWYLDEQEFYRFVPKNDPPHTTFAVRDIQVNISNSNDHDVTLVKVRRNHSGRYKCEVSEEAPLYDTHFQEASILVVDVPEMEPRIAVDRQHLTAGETLRANCTSGASRPAPNITWTLNGAPLHNFTKQFRMHSRSMPVSGKYNDKNRTHSTLSLDTTGMFQDGRIRLRCFAEISPVYKASASIEVTEDGPYLASITGDAAPHSHQSSGCATILFGSHGTTMQILCLILGLLLRDASIR